jgi:hypothetical protein
MDYLDGLTPTEYLIMNILVARYRLGDNSWTFPTRFGATLNSLEERGYLSYKSGVLYKTLHAWLTPEGAKYANLDQPYMLHGEQRGRCWVAESGGKR